MCVLAACPHATLLSARPKLERGCWGCVRGNKVDSCVPEGATVTGSAVGIGDDTRGGVCVDGLGDKSRAMPLLALVPDAAAPNFSRFACNFCCSLDSFLGAEPLAGDAVRGELTGLAPAALTGDAGGESRGAEARVSDTGGRWAVARRGGICCRRGALALVPTLVNPSSVSGLLAARPAACLTCKDTYLRVCGPVPPPAPSPP